MSPASAILSRLPAARLMYRASTLRAAGGADARVEGDVARVAHFGRLQVDQHCQATFARAGAARVVSTTPRPST